MNQLYNTIASTVGGPPIPDYCRDSEIAPTEYRSRFGDRSYNTIAPTFTNKINLDADNFTGYP